MATDHDYDPARVAAAHALQSPSETPAQTPLSRRSSRIGSPLTDTPASSPALPIQGRRFSEDVANEDGISVLDPRRFTPTLHASLVSEILSLRRELDSKHKFIEDLEGTLLAAKTENEALDDQVSHTSKENRSFRLQLQELESGTLSALEELAKERDQAKSTNADLKARLENAQKKIRSQEEDSDRTHNLWERDKDSWDTQKRSLERRVHVSETRLKVVLDELQHHASNREAAADSEAEDNTRDSGFGNESDTGSVTSVNRKGAESKASRHNRTISNSSQRSFGRSTRQSVRSGTGYDGATRVNGISLADELKFDEEDEDLEEMAMDESDFPEHEMRARRALESRQSNYADDKAKRILGLTEHRGSFIGAAEGMFMQPLHSEPTVQEEDVEEPPRRPAVAYVHTGTQFSPPPSPLDRPESQPECVADAERPTGQHATTSFLEEHTDHEKPIMVSSSSQTIEPPPSPPATPAILESSKKPFQIPVRKPVPVRNTSSSTQTDPPPQLEPEPMTPVTVPVKTSSTSTQTDPLPELEPKPVAPLTQKHTLPPISIPVPSIAIHPPLSAPGSPKETMLPPGTKNAGSQTSFDPPVQMRSCSVQTEEIRIDKRPIKLPPHLLPSAISSSPPIESAKPKPERRPLSVTTRFPSGGPAKVPLPRVTQDKVSSPTSASTVQTEDRYPGNNDNGPLERGKGPGIRRPFRTSSLFAGFDGPSSDEEENAEEQAEHERPMAPTPHIPAPRPKHSRPFTKPPTPVPEEKEVVSAVCVLDDPSGKGKAVIYNSHTYGRRNSSDKTEDAADAKRGSFERQARVSKPGRGNSLSRSSSIRRSALIQSGATAHFQRPRTPSLGDVESDRFRGRASKPPFPVPTRSSSRRIPFSKSEGSQSPTTRIGEAFHNRRSPVKRQLAKQDSLRKVRSATAIPRNRRNRSRSPPLPSTPSDLHAPQLPPLPSDVVSSPQSGYATHRLGHHSQPSTNTTLTGNGSTTSSALQTSVVDAIAATMVGEWMWKYVRRRSFGVTESQQELAKAAEDAYANASGNGVRHKRWVWLSPYERAIMWSSKQPTTGTALMGKSGRKLTIQSVLDVRDDTPMPKSATTQPVFNRSILVLTPARALKFTATSKERHHLWLAALSFLAHSVGPLDGEFDPRSLDVSTAQPQAQPPPHVEREPPPRSQGATLRKAHIRDSVRLAKNRDNQRPRQPAVRDPIDELGKPALSNGSATAPLDHRPSIPDIGTGSATPPSIPRFSQYANGAPGHGRKRSSTGPRSAGATMTTHPIPPIPHSLLRSFSSQPHQLHKHVPSTATASEAFYNSAGQPPSVPSSVYNPPSACSSEADSSFRHNFFDAIGTVRMEAFVEGVAHSGGRRFGSTSEASDASAAFPPIIPRLRSGRVPVMASRGWEEEADPFRGF